MSEKKIVFDVKKFHDGGFLGLNIIGGRTWTLQAFDSSYNLICEVSQKESNNFIKYVKFIKKVSECDYELTREQINKIRTDGFFDERFISFITKDHIFEVADIQGYSKEFVLDLPNKSNDLVEKFGLDLGLFPDEIYTVIDKLKSIF
jgi:hypothetical protein